MNKKLAIKGHATRGNEIIKILKMLGGEDQGFSGSIITNYYFLNSLTHIDVFGINSPFYNNHKDEYILFTLEEFLEKYPFKVMDKVIDDSGESGIIIEMKWDEEIIYKVDFGKECYYFTSDFLRPYKETNMIENKFGTAINPVESKSNAVGLKDDKINIDDNAIFSFNHTMRPEVNADGMLCYKIPDGYESFSIQEGMIILKPKKPTYPKTIIEVLDYWYPNREPEDNYQYIYKKELIKSFQLCCIAVTPIGR